ncbi:MAG: FtsQ-type POTRA domain-containing protein [Nitrospiraceae bacterium]|nr:FtsQ-type POTRA domain-containing protein [Nitrospiraceae bacterium]
MRGRRGTKASGGAMPRQRAGSLLGKMRAAAVFVLPVIAVGVIVYLFTMAARSAFPLARVVFTGNAHLPDEELRNISGLKAGENLLALSAGAVSKKMLGSPWIRSASVRKEFPDSLHVLIREAEPFALLDMKGRLFIVDEQGRMLEELKDTPVPFLPVISGNPFSEKAAYTEAVGLAAAIRRTGLQSRKDRIEIIAHKPTELSVNIDGVVVKIGTGEYDDKLGRLMELEEEIKARRIPVDYIDVRFANRIIVKPVNEVVR